MLGPKASKQHLSNAKAQNDRKDVCTIVRHDDQHEGVRKRRLDGLKDATWDIVRGNERRNALRAISRGFRAFFLAIAGVQAT